MEDDWIFLGDGVGGRSESDTVSASDDDDVKQSACNR
jgi:hypothetical protein